MRQRNRESSTDSDPQDQLFFGSAEDDLLDDPRGDDRYAPNDDPRNEIQGAAGSRLETRRRSRQRRRRGVLVAVIAVFVVVVVAATVLIGLPLYHYFRPSDYSGAGTGSVVVTVHTNDGSAEIGSTLVADDVVASRRAFTDAAAANSKSLSIQPGSYRLHEHMSSKAALNLLLDPAARVNSDIVVTEGATVFDVEGRLIAARCTASSAANTICGLGLDRSAVLKALADVKELGLPTDFTSSTATPSSAEGFLYPATYAFDDTTTPAVALQTMVSRFTDQARSSDFTARAKALHITPYQELIIASIAQSEARYPSDMAKVARVILNRLAANRALQIDATSAYECKRAGTDPSKCVYDQVQGPYNSYNHSGLPPTPISNPGAEAMNAAAHPPSGNWLFYVNRDAAGHLFFTNSETAFGKAVAKCTANNWGCG